MHGIAFAPLHLHDAIAGIAVQAGRRTSMLNWSLTFLVVALIAAVLGLWGIAGTATWIAKVLFLVFIVLFLISYVSGRRKLP